MEASLNRSRSFLILGRITLCWRWDSTLRKINSVALLKRLVNAFTIDPILSTWSERTEADADVGGEPSLYTLSNKVSWTIRGNSGPTDLEVGRSTQKREREKNKKKDKKKERLQKLLQKNDRFFGPESETQRRRAETGLRLIVD